MTKDDLRNALRELLPSKEEICQAIRNGVADAMPSDVLIRQSIEDAFPYRSEILDSIYAGCHDALVKGRHHAR